MLSYFYLAMKTITEYELSGNRPFTVIAINKLAGYTQKQQRAQFILHSYVIDSPDAVQQ